MDTTTRSAYGYGIATILDNSHPDAGAILDVWYPQPALGVAVESLGTTPEPPAELLSLAEAGQDSDRQVVQQVVFTQIDLDAAPGDAADAYLRLHLLSHRLALPNSLNLEGIFAALSNVVWTNYGPCAVPDFELVRARLRARGTVTVYGVDKFPRMVDYVIPGGVRIADADRVRLGAHLAEGTTVMHEGFVNFNAGTLGTSMVEGRISAGVVVGDGSDIGGGASIMGTLSGGGRERISLGEGVLLGANSGLGISLGNDCIVEAGLYITAGTRVRVLDPAATADPAVEASPIVKALRLSGASNLLFRRNSVSGEVEALSSQGTGVELNEVLHSN